MRKIVSALLVLCMMFVYLTAFAEDAAAPEAAVYTTADGVLSIQAPDENWSDYPDPSFWFAMTDGDDYIIIEHLSNGEALPAATVANDEFAAVYQAYVSTKNEVFVIIGCAVEQETLKDIMQAISTVKILQFDTKQAIKPVAVTQDSEFDVEPYNAVLYCKSKHLNVRSSWSAKSTRLGYLKRGQTVEVTGIVRRNGRDFGWYAISFNGGTAYVSAKYLSTKKPGNSTREDPPDGFTQDPDAPNQPEEARDDVFSQDPSAPNQPGEAIDNGPQDPSAL